MNITQIIEPITKLMKAYSFYIRLFNFTRHRLEFVQFQIVFKNSNYYLECEREIIYHSVALMFRNC